MKKLIGLFLFFMVFSTSCSRMGGQAEGVSADEVSAGLQADGSVVLEVATVADTQLTSRIANMKTVSEKAMIEISAPIFTRVETLYESESENYPTTAEGESALVRSVALTFPKLLVDCANQHGNQYGGIKIPGSKPLTKEEVTTNYAQVAQCAYEKYTSKPYWIPKLVDNVDICTNELGEGWKLISEEDVNELTAEQIQYLHDTLAASGAEGLGVLYVNLNVFVRAADGSIKQADLEPGVEGNRVTAIPAVGEELKKHLEGARTLRCIKRTTK